jgi:hypothetical protein
MAWTPKNTKTAAKKENEFCYYGSTTDGKSVLVYGEKTDGEREPQTKRRLNVETIEKMFRGFLGLEGEKLLPIPGTRNKVDLACLNDDECPAYEAYCTAVGNLIDDGHDVPAAYLPEGITVDAEADDNEVEDFE